MVIRRHPHSRASADALYGANQDQQDSATDAAEGGNARPLNPAMVGLLNYTSDPGGLAENTALEAKARERDAATGFGAERTVMPRPGDLGLEEAMAGTRAKQSRDYSATPHGIANNPEWWQEGAAQPSLDRIPGYDRGQQLLALRGLYGRS